ncbi:MAG: rod shape-determining protein MreD [Gammaproteobacteria bacterium]|nr:rod shape-determining protein MreD [Gammaproteobacteria bacterium]
MRMNRVADRLPALLTFLIGLILTLLPLPSIIDPFRPSWIALLIIFWAIYSPQIWSVGSAWIIGIFIDVTQGSFLGQHALAFSFIAFITIRFHLIIRFFPLLQLTFTILPILAIYQFLLFWINGVGDNNAPLLNYWGPVISSTALWPFILISLSGLRNRI